MLTLRPYQEQAAGAFRSFVDGGGRRGALVLPTGTGKTCTALEIARRFKRRTLWLAHRLELIEQPRSAVRDVWPEADVGVVRADQNECSAKDLVIASVQTLSRGDCARLQECGQFGLVVLDECHHAVAESYGALIEKTGCLAGAGPTLLGLTGTPERDGFDETFEKIFYDYPLRRAIQEGYLCPLGTPRQIRIPGLDLSSVPTARGDFVTSKLGEEMLKAHVADHTAKGVKTFASTRRTIVYTVLVEQAHLTAKALNGLGLKAEAISGETPEGQRRDVLEKFASGEIQIVCNAGVLTEGYDNPRVDCIVIARPTKSSILYRQMLGRGLRPHPDKTNLMVVDLADATGRFDAMHAGAFAKEMNPSAPARVQLPSGDSKSALGGLIDPKTDVPRTTGSGSAVPAKPSAPIDFSESTTEEENPSSEFWGVGTPDPIMWVRPKVDPRARTKPKATWYASTNVGTVCVFPVDNEWIIAFAGDRKKRQFHRIVARCFDQMIAIGTAADVVRNAPGGRMFSTTRFTNWRADKPTTGQIGMLKYLGYPIPKTKGEAAERITFALGEKAVLEITNMIRDRAKGFPAPWLKDESPTARAGSRA